MASHYTAGHSRQIDAPENDGDADSVRTGRHPGDTDRWRSVAVLLLEASHVVSHRTAYGADA